jgi:ribosomal-protein-alanine N-acetyltransferase
MKTLIPNVLQTQRLILRPYQPADIDDILKYASSPDWARFIPVPQPYTKEDAHRYIQEFIEMSPTHGIGFAVTFQHMVIGGIRVRLFLESHKAELGYSISPYYWRNGFAFEAVRMVIDTCFESITTLNKISANVDSRNISSRNLLIKIGLKEEGVLRENRFMRGQSIDEAWYGILRKEWVHL